jgi:dienelactone hydrolase
MRNFFFALIILPLTAVFSQDKEKDYKPEATQIYTDLRNGNYARATANFDTSVTSRLDTAKLRKIWENLEKVAGPFQSVLEVTTDHQPTYDVVIQKTQFEKKKIDFKLVFGSNDKVKGISFLPGEPKIQYKLPDYYKPDMVVERPLALQNGPYRLPGVLSEPKTPGRHPVVVLIHGSGPNDKDESVGPMKIFKDFACGLPLQGIAVYRYDKRLRIYAAKMMKDKDLTVEEETVEDAIAAVKMLKADSTIDSNQVFLCGHGLGGMLLPRIAKGVNVKGMIFIAVNSRPLSETIYDQTAYVISLDSTEQNKKALMDSVDRQMQIIRTLKKPTADTSFYFRLPAGYWADLNGYNHVKAAKESHKPLLFIHGGRDYQIPESDFNKWKTELKDANATFKLYPDLNHFLVKGEEKSRPSEYGRGGNVDVKVINDMTEWIKSQMKK